MKSATTDDGKTWASSLLYLEDHPKSAGFWLPKWPAFTLPLTAPEHRLDEPDVGPVVVHQRRHRVAEQVARPTLADPRRIDVATHQERQGVGRHRLAQVIEEQHVLGVVAHDQRRPDLVEVLADPRQGPVADRDHPVLPALALPHDDRAPLLVEVVDVEVGKLRAADVRRVERLQDGPIPDAQRLAHVGLGDDLLGLARRQDVLREAIIRRAGIATETQEPRESPHWIICSKRQRRLEKDALHRNAIRWRLLPPTSPATCR